MITIARPAQSDHEQLQALAPRRLNVGCGCVPLPYWINLDEAPDVLADIHQHVPPLPFDDTALDDIFACHFLEHLTPEEADLFLDECWRCLTPGGRLGLVVPDTREVMKRHLRGDLDEIEWPRNVWHKVSDLDALCRLFFYSSIQESPHRWSYDMVTLGRLIERHGFTLVTEIERFSDPRIAVGAFYQCGWDSVKRAL